MMKIRLLATMMSLLFAMGSLPAAEFYVSPSRSDMNPGTKPKSVTLLRAGNALDFECRDGSLRVVVPQKMQTDLPDMVKIVF